MLKVSARIFPIGTVLEGETPDYNPNEFYIDGIWEVTQQGMVSVGLDENQLEFNEIGKTGGEKEHELTVDEMPKHQHKQRVGTGSGSWGSNFATVIGESPTSILETNTYEAGGGKKHNNMPPFKVTYKWKLVSYSN